MASLENYPFLTPSVGIKKASLYGVSTRAILSRFSNTAAVEVWWNTSLVVANRNQTCRGPETGLEEINSDFLEADFRGPIRAKGNPDYFRTADQLGVDTA